MPSLLRRRRYLECFYCGGKTSTLYDGVTRRFDCPFCDAPNYLDEKGDITDPPVATEQVATPPRSAVARPVGSPIATPERRKSDVFCAKCLKNQHLLTSSLAQYLPEPDDPDYAERERNLPRYRKILERLYPQICSDCEPKVRRRLDQAAYTAKTDLLRRMLDRTAQERKTSTSRRIEKLDKLGWRLWVAASVLQLFWHLVVVEDLVTFYASLFQVQSGSYIVLVLEWLAPVFKLVPRDRLLDLSILASILSVWWNPRFAQVSRGLSKHIRGLWLWWLFQAATLILRFGIRRMDLTNPDPTRLNVQVTGHFVAAVICLFISVVSPRVVRTSPAPIFKAPPTQQRHQDSPESSPDEIKSMADLLTEISHSPTSTSPPSPDSPEYEAPSPIIRRNRNRPPMGHFHRQAAETFDTSMQKLDSLNIAGTSSSNYTRATSAPPTSTPANNSGDVDAMDWTPTYSHTTGFTATLNSPYRAFNTRGQREGERFNAAPTDPNRGVFWYRVPPAPTPPAQRLYNAQNQPRLRPFTTTRTSPGSIQGAGAWTPGKPIRFSGAGGATTPSPQGQGTGTWTPEKGIQFSSPSPPGAAGGGEIKGPRDPKMAEAFHKLRRDRPYKDVEIAPPRIWPETLLGKNKNDPRNELISSFSAGLSLDDHEQEDGEAENGKGGWLKKLVPW